MKGFTYRICLVLFACLLVGCGSNEINPGDKVSGFLVTKNEGMDVTYVWDLDCEQEGDAEVYACKTNVGTNANVSVGIYAPRTGSGKDLDTIWEEHSYELFINDRPVNLDAFGYIEIKHPIVGPMRVWDVVIVGDRSGEITFHDKGVVDGESFESTNTIAFSTPTE